LQADFTGIQDVVPKLSRPRKRLAELLAKSALEPPTQKQLDIWGNSPSKRWHLKLLRSPTEILADTSGKRVGGIALQINKVKIFSVLQIWTSLTGTCQF